MPGPVGQKVKLTDRQERPGRALLTQQLARLGIEPVGNCIQLRLTVNARVQAFWQILAQQAIRVFIDAALLKTVRMGKEHLPTGLPVQVRMVSYLPALIAGQRQTHLRIDRLENFNKTMAPISQPNSSLA